MIGVVALAFVAAAAFFVAGMALVRGADASRAGRPGDALLFIAGTVVCVFAAAVVLLIEAYQVLFVAS